MTDSYEQELETLRARIAALEAQIHTLGHEPIPLETKIPANFATDEQTAGPNRLELDEYIRYGRQMILPGFGLPSQLALHASSILVVGAGGLGCPALMYLASAGVGRITIVDHDKVELSNLHRQVLHGVDMVGKPKAESAKQALLRINPLIEITTQCISLTLSTLSTVFSPAAHFHAVLDCSDTPSTRYLLSDVTARLGIPLISGAAQRTDGQLVVYNLPSGGSRAANASSVTAHGPGNESSTPASPVNPPGPCMRCVFPSVSRTGAGAERCSEVGVLGPVVGVIGVLMALETIKVLTGFGTDECQLHAPSMLLFTALSPRPFKTIKLRPRQQTCQGCSKPSSNNLPQNRSILKFIGETASLEGSYNEFCDGPASPEDPIMTGARQGQTRVKASVLKEALATAPMSGSARIVVIDTRPPTEFGICSIPESINVPLAQLLKTPEQHVSSSARTFIVCRLGNDSQIAARALRDALYAREGPSISNAHDEETTHQVVDVIGGLRAWAQEVDPLFPIY